MNFPCRNISFAACYILGYAALGRGKVNRKEPNMKYFTVCCDTKELKVYIEFLYRDAKQHCGLEDCQARSKINSIFRVSCEKFIYIFANKSNDCKTN